MDHGQTKDNLGRIVHSTTCQKCRLEKQAKDLKIAIHEWPLPRSTVPAQWIVFELSPPRSFSAWRDITYMVLHDIGLPLGPDSRLKPGALLDSLSYFKPWAAGHLRLRRVTISSTKPPFPKQNVMIPTEESSVLVNNQQSFMPFDRQAKSWVV